MVQAKSAQKLTCGGRVACHARGVADGVANQTVWLHDVNKFMLRTAIVDVLRTKSVVFDGQAYRIITPCPFGTLRDSSYQSGALHPPTIDNSRSEPRLTDGLSVALQLVGSIGLTPCGGTIGHLAMIREVVPLRFAMDGCQRGTDFVVGRRGKRYAINLGEALQQLSLPMCEQQEVNNTAITKFDKGTLLRVERRVCAIRNRQHIDFNTLEAAAAVLTVALQNL